MKVCLNYLQAGKGESLAAERVQRRADLVLMLFNHHDFVTIR